MMKRLLIHSIEEWDSQKVLSILGPTGAGKTSLLLDFLRSSKFTSQKPLLVSVDAVAVYKKLNIGSAKVMGDDRYNFDWAGIDLVDIRDTITLRSYLDAVEPQIVQALNEKQPVVLVGGTGFYEKALVEGVALGAASDPDYQKDLESRSNEDLHAYLAHFDKRWAGFLHVNDRYRLTRYMDLVDRQGFSWEDLRETTIRHPELKKLWNTTQCLWLGLDKAREEYEAALATRVDQMLEQGWVQEVEALLCEGYSANDTGLQTMGYLEICQHLSGQYDLQAARSKIIQAHLQYVKRQKTWIRGIKI